VVGVSHKTAHSTAQTKDCLGILSPFENVNKNLIPQYQHVFGGQKKIKIREGEHQNEPQ
jgi:hypothetical protein